MRIPVLEQITPSGLGKVLLATISVTKIISHIRHAWCNMCQRAPHSVAAILGAFSALGFAPWRLWPLVVIAFYGIQSLLTLNTPSARRLLSLAFVFGFAHWLIGLYWVVVCFAVDWKQFWWLAPLALFGIPFILAWHIAIPLFLAHRLWRAGLARAFVLVGLLTVSELLRSHPLFFHFPWNLWGHVVLSVPALSQVGALIGSHGLSTVVLLMAVLPHGIVSEKSLLRGGIAVFLLAIMSAGILTWGTLRLHIFQAHSSNLPSSPPLRVRIVQPNISQHDKWKAETAWDQLDTLIDLSRSRPLDGLQLVVWPEAAVSWYPRMLDENPERRQFITSMLQSGQFLLTGTNRAQRRPGHETTYYNTMMLLDATGQVVANYDKNVLLPFGEFIPFRSLLAWLLPGVAIHKITQGMVDFTPGSGARHIAITGLPTIAPLICSETLYDHPGLQEAKLIVAISNDAWFGNSPGPHQHLAATSMRALELGRPVVHCANSGISALINPLGRIEAFLEVGKAGILDLTVPAELETFYGRHGGPWIALLMAAFLILMGYGLRKKPSPA